MVIAVRDAAYNLYIANMNGALPDEAYVEMLKTLYNRGLGVLEKRSRPIFY